MRWVSISRRQRLIVCVAGLALAHPPRVQAQFEELLKPILIQTLRDSSNEEQRKGTKKRYLTLVAQQAEDILRSELFQEIVGFVEDNRDLFRDLYARMKGESSIAGALPRATKALTAQGELVVEAERLARQISEAEGFTATELEALASAVAEILAEAAGDVSVLTRAFAGELGAHVPDAEKLELLEHATVRLAGHSSAIRQLSRYVSFLSTQRSASAAAERSMLGIER